MVSYQREYRQEVLEKYSEHFEHAQQLEELANTALANFRLNLPDLECQYRAVHLLFLKAFRSFCSISRLCKMGYAQDAGIILRSLFNLCIIAHWISADDKPESHNRAVRYLNWIWVVLYKRAKVHPNEFPNLAFLQARYDEIKHLYDQDPSGEVKSQSWHGITIRKMSREVGLEHEYLTLYPFLSSLEHSDSLSSIMLAEHQVSDLPPDISIIAETIGYGYLYFSYVFAHWNTHAGFEAVPTVQLNEVITAGRSFFFRNPRSC